MLRYSTPSTEISKLNLAETSSKNKNGLPVKMSSRSQKQKAAATRHSSSATNSRSSRTTRGSTGEPSSHRSGGRRRSERIREQADESEDDDDEAGEDEGEDGESDEEGGHAQQAALNQWQQNIIRIREVISTLTDPNTSLTPSEISDLAPGLQNTPDIT